MGPFNFCNPKMNPRIASNKLSMDGHEVGNLVAESWSSNRGFLVESFIRPPVSVSLMFPCNIDIDRIIINGAVGAQKSSSFETYTFSADRTREPFDERWDRASGHILHKDSYDSHIFGNVGRLNQNSNSDVQSLICFRNPRFRIRPSFANVVPMDSKLFNQQCLMSELRPGRNIRNLCDVSHLTIRINQAARGSVPALKWIEIWGQPSSSCSKQDINMVLKVYNESKSSSTVNSQQQLSSLQSQFGDASSVPCPKRISNGAQSNVAIPAEFLDAITCEVMMLPMLLPCGKSIDQSTLEKHNHQEASWGRAPNNPFTGVPFSKNSKPLPNAALKLRIDHFLLSDHNMEKNLAPQRTLGTAGDILSSERNPQNIQTSVLVRDKAERKDIITPPVLPSDTRQKQSSAIPGPSVSLDDALDLLLNDLPSYHPPVSSAQQNLPSGNISSSSSKAETSSKYSRTKGVSACKRSNPSNKGLPNKRSRTQQIANNTVSQASNVIDLTCDDDSVRISQSNTHEEWVSSSLDKALEETLGSLPSFHCPRSARVPVHASNWRNCSKECVFCSQSKDPNSIYKLACGDITCRECLTLHKSSLNIIKCKKCGTASTSKDIVKVHS